MKKILFLCLLISLIFPLILFRRQSLLLVHKIFYYSQCNDPIKYSLGTIDPGFNTTADQLLGDSKSAANIWNSMYNKQLLEYDPNSDFKINLVYDKRQELNSKINDLSTELSNKQNDIDPKIAQFNLDKDSFEKKLAKLNADIAYWNGQGGAPKEEFDKLVNTQQDLRNEAKNLNNTAKNLGQQTSSYNLNAAKLNQTIDDFKDVLGQKPEEGLFEQNGSTRTISIYIDINHEEFLHTLAHEMGHSIGLSHTQDKNSIMYHKTNNILVPTIEEKEALDEICRERTIFEIIGKKAQELVSIYRIKIYDLIQKPGK